MANNLDRLDDCITHLTDAIYSLDDVRIDGYKMYGSISSLIASVVKVVEAEQVKIKTGMYNVAGSRSKNVQQSIRLHESDVQTTHK